MKKTAIAGTLMAGAMALTIVLGGCGAQQQAAPAPSEPAAQEQTSQTTVQEEAKKDDAAVAETQVTTSSEEQATTSTTTPSEQQASQISEDEAKQIALNDAGVAEQDTAFLTVNLDTDDGVTKYEVDFNVGQTEYDYDIDPVTGAILEHSSEIDD